MKRRFGDESGQGMLEYVLIVVLVVVAAIGAWRYFGRETGKLVDTSNEQLKNVEKDTKVIEGLNKSYDPSRAKAARDKLAK